jgi:ABC-type Fe3+-siderophore transport system permease subunit
VFVLARGGGLDSARLVLVGVGLSAGLGGLTTLLVVATNPWDTPRALTWLCGSTYGRTMSMVLPVALAFVLIAPLVLTDHRRLDLLALDDDTPRLLGVRLDRTRVLHLSGAAILTAGAVCAVGVVGFVGLVAPHCARSLVGGRHRRVLPLAAILGALLVSVADTLGRTVIAPAQIPAGLVTAIVGAPHFVYLLWRTRD